MAYETLLVERADGPVGWLIFDRPDAGNAMDALMFGELEAGVAELDADPAVRVIVNTGNGPAFRTGIDVVQVGPRQAGAARAVAADQGRRAATHVVAQAGCWKPVIAAVNGVCAGGGLHFVADADIVVAARRRLVRRPARLGRARSAAYEAIAPVRKSPMEPIVRMALVGTHERIDAQRVPDQLGIVVQVVDPPDGLRDAAPGRWPRRSPRNSPTAMRATKQALWGALELGLTDACRAGGRELTSACGAIPTRRRARRPSPRNGDAPSGAPPRPTREDDGMTYRSLDRLKLSAAGRSGWLINDRPDRLNAMTARCATSSPTPGRSSIADPDVRVIVHTGEGRAFQTGVDVAEIASDGVGMQRYRRSVEDFDLHFTGVAPAGVRKPVITAVNGMCAGGGFHWVADADVVIAASDAEFFDPHVSIGQVVSLEAIGLMRKMPVEAVMRMALVGRHERLSAPRAYELGMISEVVDPPERLRDEAQALAEKIARNSPAAMRGDQARRSGARSSTGLTDACRDGAEHLVVDVGPSRPGGGPAGVRREAPATLAGPHRALTFAGRFPDQSGLTYRYGRGRSRAGPPDEIRARHGAHVRRRPCSCPRRAGQRRRRHRGAVPSLRAARETVRPPAPEGVPALPAHRPHAPAREQPVLDGVGGSCSSSPRASRSSGCAT